MTPTWNVLDEATMVELTAALAEKTGIDLIGASVVASGSRVVGNYHAFSDVDFYVRVAGEFPPEGHVAHRLGSYVCQFNHVSEAALEVLTTTLVPPLVLTPRDPQAVRTVYDHDKLASRIATGRLILGPPMVPEGFLEGYRQAKISQLVQQISRLLEDLAGSVLVADGALILGACQEIMRDSLELALAAVGDLQYGEILTVSRADARIETAELRARLARYASALEGLDRDALTDHPVVLAVARTASWLSLATARRFARDDLHPIPECHVPDFLATPGSALINPYAAAVHYSDGRSALLLPDRAVRVNVDALEAIWELTSAWGNRNQSIPAALTAKRVASSEELSTAAWLDPKGEGVPHVG